MAERPSASALVLLDKEAGLTSFEALEPLKKIVGRKCGHAGTLDRFASGLLVAFSGRLTGLCPLLAGLPKVYEARISFGRQTATLDPEGEVVASAPPPSLQAVEDALPSFLGVTAQAPPAYSAVHVGGRRAWRLARGGQAPEMPPRPVELHSYEVLGWEEGVLRMRLRVSKGFYVRSFARDLALACGSRAHLAALRRLSIGPYLVSEAAPCSDPAALEEWVGSHGALELLGRLDGARILDLDPDEERRLSNGVLPAALKGGAPLEGFWLLRGGGSLRAVVDGRGRFLAQGL